MTSGQTAGGRVRIGFDVGGTFTDLVLHDPARGITRTGKLPTTPAAPNEAITVGIARLLADTGTPPEQVGGLVHGTTLVTNAVLERTGAKVGLIATEGFRDVLEMGNEYRYDTTDLHSRPASVLVPRHRRLVVRGRLSSSGAEIEPLDEQGVVDALTQLVRGGVEAVAVSLLHAYRNPAHEERIRALAAEHFGSLPITLSSEVAPVVREYPRTSTTCLNAYVQPTVTTYLDELVRDLEGLGIAAPLRIMLSGGGVTTIEDAKRVPVRLLESGPAAGVIASSSVARTLGEDRVISFDMGGTTAKMASIEHGRPRVAHDFEAGRVDKFSPGSGLPVLLTVVDMIEIGSGGGSIAHGDHLGLLKVGPRSAGSVPGPVAYGRGGEQPTVTDADLVLGKLDPYYFLGGDMPLSLDRVESAFAAELGNHLGMTVTECARGVAEVVTASMAAATRMHLAEKGRDPSDYTLVAFGGAGPVHAYELAKALKMRRIVVPVNAGVMSAYGFLVAAPEVNEVRSHPSPLAQVNWGHVASLYVSMESAAREVVDLDDPGVDLHRTVDMRYVGQGYEVEVTLPALPDTGSLEDAHPGALIKAFEAEYEELFGRTLPDHDVEVVSWRLTARGRLHEWSPEVPTGTGASERGSRTVHFPGIGDVNAPVHERYCLTAGQVLKGPVVIQERDSSCAFGPDCTVTVNETGHLVVRIDYEPTDDAARVTT